jgi:rhamnogalacturonyl hydrolase YesR
VDRLPDLPSAWPARDSSASRTFATGIVVSISEANLAQMTEAVLQDGYAIVQEFVDGGEDGDASCSSDRSSSSHGMPAAFQRVPTANDGPNQQGRTLSPSPDG